MDFRNFIGYLVYENEISDTTTHEVNLFPLTFQCTKNKEYIELQIMFVWSITLSLSISF